MTPLELIRSKREHAARLANQRGAEGEIQAIDEMQQWLPRPKGTALKVLLSVLREEGIATKPTSFDAVSCPGVSTLDFANRSEIQAVLNQMVFIEIKTADQERVQPGFDGFFFALTEGEIAAAEQLGSRHRVALYNRRSGELQLTSVPEILSRSRSMNWQVSVQL